MTHPTAQDVAAIVGQVGEIVGRTKLQKTFALLELAGLGPGFSFSYHHFGPYSEQLTATVDRAALLGMVSVSDKVAAWGGRYSIFSAPKVKADNPALASLVELAARSNSIALELAVTAGFLAAEGDADPWGSVAELKPDKARDHLQKARDLYAEFCALRTPKALPAI